MSLTPECMSSDLEASLLSLTQAANAIGGAILTIREEAPLLEMVLTRLRKEFPTNSGVIFLYEEQHLTTASVQARRGHPSPLAHIRPMIERLLPDCGGIVQVYDGTYSLNAADLCDICGLSLGEVGIAGLVLVPLVTRGAPMGAIALELKTPTVLPSLITELLRLIGQFLASGLRERRLQARLDAANRKLEIQNEWQGNTDYTDELTGMANLTFFQTELDRVVAEGVQTGGNVSLLRVEIDRYKALQEAYGQPFAEGVLRSVAQTIQASIRGRDLGIHGAEDLFYVLLPVTPGIGAVVVAERLRDRLSALNFEVPEGTWHLTACIGVACLSNRVVSADELLAKSQRCLLQSKAFGGNQVFFDWDEALETSGEG